MDKDYSVSGLATCSASRRRTAVSRSALLAGLKLNPNICLGLFLEYVPDGANKGQGIVY